MRGSRTLPIRVKARPLELSPAAARALARAATYDWILFASAHAAEHFASALRARKVPLPREPRIAAVGPVTARAVRGLGLRVQMIPERHTARDLANALHSEYGVYHKRILIPRSALASDDAPRRLRERGASVRIVTLYEPEVVPLTAKEHRGLLSGAYNTLSFSSPSGIAGFLRQLSAAERLKALRLIARCIGPTTARAARVAGFKKVIA